MVHLYIVGYGAHFFHLFSTFSSTSRRKELFVELLRTHRGTVLMRYWFRREHREPHWPISFILAFQSSQHSHYWKLYPQTLCSENISNTYCCLWNNYTSKHLCSMLCFPRYCSSLNKQRYLQCPTGTISQVYPSKVVENKRTRWVSTSRQSGERWKF